MYLAIGMTYEQYWENESWLVKAYREAEKLKQRNLNHIAWLHGLYTYEALQAGVPAHVMGFAKSHVDLPHFPEKPHDPSEEAKKKKETKQMELQRAKMQEMVEQFNRTFLRKKAAKEGQK